MENESLQYIQDWQKRAKSKQLRYNIIMIIFLTVAVIVCLAFVWNFKNENYNRIVEHNKKYIQDSAIQEADQVEQKIFDTVTLIKKLAQQYIVIEETAPSTSIEERIEMLCDRSMFDRIAYISPDGLDTSLEGCADVSEEGYFKNAMNGNTGYDFIPVSQVTGRPSLIFYAPITIDGEIIGILAGFYERERLDALLSYEFLNFSPDTYLLTSDGTVVADSTPEYRIRNIFDELNEKQYQGDIDFEAIKSAIEDSERTSIAFIFSQGEKSVIGVIAQFDEGSADDWLVLSILPYQITEDMIAEANSAGRTMISAIVISLILTIVISMILLTKRYNSLEKDMAVTAENLKITTQHDQTQSFIISSLGNTYSSIYYILISDNTYRRIKEDENSVKSIPTEGDWTVNFGKYLESFVDESYIEKMNVFNNIFNFESRLSESDKITVEYQRSDKTWRKAVMMPAEYDDDGKIISLIFAVQQINEEKQKELNTQAALREAYEAAQLASTAKTTFLSNMSHDIRTPMNAIVGMTAIAGANLGNPEKVGDCLKKIAGASKHLLGLINEVLDMSKIESGKIDLNEEDFSLSDLIDDLINMNQSLIKEKGHNLTVTIGNLVHENVRGDSIRLQQVFNNLFTNAIKYTPQGGNIEITIREKQTNKSTIGWYEVVFTDDGIGMTEEFSKRIFEPFSRSEDERISNIQGTGLGMAIARNIIRMMNGDIVVKSELNKGSSFIVSFSLRLQNEKETDRDEFTALSVLVVDDEKSSCESTCVMLNSLSMESEWVTSGKDAVARVSQRHEDCNDYNAVIVDWIMPEMDGIQTAAEIRSKVGEDVPIIVLTAYDWSEIETKAREAGVNAFLSKPLFKSRLVNLFRNLNCTGKEKADETAEEEDFDFSGKRILLAEDNELNSEIATELLSMIGLETEHAENGKVCLEMFTSSESGYYDLIFMDIQMPVMNGYEAAKSIRSSDHPDAATIPIVAMTANAFSTDVRSAFDSGMNGHISKPVELPNIINVLKEFFK